jgi:hypothetical protein
VERITTDTPEINDPTPAAESPAPAPVRGVPWPPDAQAVISRRRHAFTNSGRAGARQWVLRFERRTPPVIEPLIGWTAGDDTLTQIELAFGSRKEAVGYAEQQGLAYRIHGEGSDRPTAAEDGQRADDTRGTVIRLSSCPTASRCSAPRVPDLDRALLSPAEVFPSPDEVLRHPLLTIDCKREILKRWLWDEYLLDWALVDGMPEGEPSRLADVTTALRLLDSEWSPDPAAPAAFVMRDNQHQLQRAA